LYQTAASFVRAYLTIPKSPLLNREHLTHPVKLATKRKGGLIVVGSFVPKTTEQLTSLLKIPSLHAIELHVNDILNYRNDRLTQIIKEVNANLAQDVTTVVYTSRKLMQTSHAEENLAVGARVSDALVTLINNLAEYPAFLIAKGGVTSSDLATKGLGVKKAMILGQALPGVPVWGLGEESKFPTLPYIIFPGNVGGPTDLKDLVMYLLYNIRT
jgi:uncharacterized protein YgbK (DUF1537 family)